jgi:hypothetical protein
VIAARWFLVLAVCLVAAVAVGVAGAARAAGASRIVTFQTPSKGIGCEYRHAAGQADALRCDVADVADPPKRPASCEQDYGSAFGLAPTGRGRRLCAGDTIRDPKAKVLAYGRTRTVGPFTCVSRTTGLTCRNGAGHGFTLSRAHQKLF